MDTKCRLEVGRLVEIVLKARSKRMTVGPDKIGLHFRLADHAIPVTENNNRYFHYKPIKMYIIPLSKLRQNTL